MSATKPDRSDLGLPPEEAARIEAETREYFERIAPKRPAKPPRSESSDDYSDALLPPADQPSTIPELDKLRELAARSVKLVCDPDEGGDEFVETGYYQDLINIDKQHYMTGTGFIKVEESHGTSLDVKPVYDPSLFHAPYKGNPATNDWIPSPDIVIPVSRKPNRSDP